MDRFILRRHLPIVEMYFILSLQIEKIEDTNMCVEFPLQEMQGREEEQKVGVDFHCC